MTVARETIADGSLDQTRGIGAGERATQINEDFTRYSKLADLGRWHISRFVAQVAARLPAGAIVLDAGAGECVYRPLFSHCKYKAVDMAVGSDKWNYANLDWIAPLHKLPIPDSSFDAILCTQTLEHVELPRESVQELHRVLKPGGTLFVTVPMAQNEHQIPYDFFRFTSYGLRSLFKSAGFREENVVIRPFGGIFTRFAYELPRTVELLPGSGLRSGGFSMKGLLLYPLKRSLMGLVRIVQAGLLVLENLDDVKDDPFGWAAIATKDTP